MIDCVFLPWLDAPVFAEFLINDRIASIAPPPHYLGLAASPISPSKPPTHYPQLPVLPVCPSMSPSISTHYILPINPHINGRKCDRYKLTVQITIAQMNLRGTRSTLGAKEGRKNTIHCFFMK